MNEVRAALRVMEVEGPYILVGFSTGAMAAQLYAERLPSEVAGLVLVEYPDSDRIPPLDMGARLENLPDDKKRLHRWALSRAPQTSTTEMFRSCRAEIESKPLGKLPLTVITAGNSSPVRTRLQAELMALSSTHRQLIAWKSSHAVHIDVPETLQKAILDMVGQLRAPPPEPTFRTSTHLVQVNVIVRQKDMPVADLTKDDFQVTDEGRHRPIAVFAKHVPPQSTSAAPALPPHTFSNRPLSGSTGAPSVTLILFDRLNTLVPSSMGALENAPAFDAGLALANAKQHVLRFIDELGPNDRIAIYSIDQDLTVLSDFTNDRERLRKPVEDFRAISLTTREIAEPAGVTVCSPQGGDDLKPESASKPKINTGCLNGMAKNDREMLAALNAQRRAETTINAMVDIASHMRAIPGRKNLVWLTASLPIAGEGVARILGWANVAVYPVDARGLIPRSVPTLSGDYGTLLDRYSMPASITSAQRPPGMDAMETLAAETGGRAFLNNNDLHSAIRAAIDDGAVTYTLGFYVEPESLDAKFHELKINVRRSGVELRAQKGYYAIAGALPGGMGAALTSPLENSAIHLLARVERVDRKLSITGSIDLRDLRMEDDGGVHKGAVDIDLVQQDASGATLARRQETMRIELAVKEYEQYLKTGIFFRSVMDESRDSKTFRVIVTDRTSHLNGSLIVPLQ